MSGGSQVTIIDFHTHVDEAPAFGWIDPPAKIVAGPPPNPAIQARGA